jgi:hypothetical protein
MHGRPGKATGEVILGVQADLRYLIDWNLEITHCTEKAPKNTTSATRRLRASAAD